MTTQPTSIKGAVDQIAGLFSASYPTGTPVASLTAAGVVKAYDHEPSTVLRGVSITTSFDGMDDTDWSIAVRLYVTDTDPRTAQRLMWDAVEAVDDVLRTGEVIGPSDWTPPVFDREESVHMIQTTQKVGRDTF